MLILGLSVAGVLVVSALCSLTEAAIYAVRMPYIGTLVESGSRSGIRLAKFKENMDQPISAILIVNTVANTAGAAVAGAQAQVLFGDGAFLWFSAVFTLGVLFFSEILPKVAGVAFSRTISVWASAPLHMAVTALYPVIRLTQVVTRLMQRGEPDKMAPEEEVAQFAAISAREGSILSVESDLVRNVLDLDKVTAGDIMTPRTVVYKLTQERTVGEVVEEVFDVSHGRIPLFPSAEPDQWAGFVLRADILGAKAMGRESIALSELSQPLTFVPNVMPCHLLLAEFVARRVHMVGVVDEYGGILGVATLEDVVETLLGQEIVDETDRDVDMQEVARRIARRPRKARGDAAAKANAKAESKRTDSQGGKTAQDQPRSEPPADA